MNENGDDRARVFGVLFTLGALLLGAALAIPAWSWGVTLTQAGFLSHRALVLGAGVFILAWLVPVTLVLGLAKIDRGPG